MAHELGKMATYFDGLTYLEVTWPFDHVVMQDQMTH